MASTPLEYPMNNRLQLSVRDTLLYDVGDVYTLIKTGVTEELGCCFDYVIHQSTEMALDAIFYSTVASGERQIERYLIQRDMPELQAIRLSRAIFRLLFAILGVRSQLELGTDPYVYHLQKETGMMLLRRDKDAPLVSTDIESMIAEIQYTLDNGGYVPEKFRRLIDEHLRH